MAERPGSLVNPIDLFRTGISFDGEFDVAWFKNIPSADAATKRLTFLNTPRNVFELTKRGYGGPALNEMWKAVFRACVSFDVPIPTELHHLASELGVFVQPE